MSARAACTHRRGDRRAADVHRAVVFLRGGNVVPADAKALEGDELAVDQAALTGESLPVAVPREDSEGEPGSGKKLWSGSIVKVGEAEAFVTETGLNTMIGEAAKSIQESGGKHVGVFEAKIIMAGRVRRRGRYHTLALSPGFGRL